MKYDFIEGCILTYNEVQKLIFEKQLALYAIRLI